jgi:cell division protein FtsL
VRTSARSRRRQRAKARGAIVWIAVAAALLAGVVFVNLAVLRLNLELDGVTKTRAKLRAENAELQSELSSALASPRIQALARKQDHLVPADPSTIGYVNLGR